MVLRQLIFPGGSVFPAIEAAFLYAPQSSFQRAVGKWRLDVEKNWQKSDNIEEYVLRGLVNERQTFSGVQKAGIRKERF